MHVSQKFLVSKTENVLGQFAQWRHFTVTTRINFTFSYWHVTFVILMILNNK